MIASDKGKYSWRCNFFSWEKIKKEPGKYAYNRISRREGSTIYITQQLDSNDFDIEFPEIKHLTKQGVNVNEL